MAGFAGKWKTTETKNFDEFMKTIGVNLALRTIGNNVTPHLTITVTGDTLNVKTTSTFKNTDQTFTFGTPFEEETLDGRKVTTTVEKVSDTKHVATQKGTFDTTITRELTDDNTLLTTYEAKGVTATRKFTRE